MEDAVTIRGLGKLKPRISHLENYPPITITLEIENNSQFFVITELGPGEIRISVPPGDPRGNIELPFRPKSMPEAVGLLVMAMAETVRELNSRDS